jgi:hypothetical protein
MTLGGHLQILLKYFSVRTLSAQVPLIYLEKCCKYFFREYISKGLERNLLVILGKISTNINLDLKNMENIRKICNLKNSEKIKNIKRNQIRDICNIDLELVEIM